MNTKSKKVTRTGIVLLAGALLLALASCSSEPKKQVKSAPKLVRLDFYNSQGALTRHYTISYNTNGTRKELRFYSPAGELTSYHIYRYDAETGLKSSLYSYTPAGRVKRRYIFKFNDKKLLDNQVEIHGVKTVASFVRFHYDPKGHVKSYTCILPLVNRTSYTDDILGESGQVMSWTTRTKSGAIVQKGTFLYDTNGLATEERVTNARGKLIYFVKRFYE